MNERAETNLDLYGQTISSAAARLTEIAEHMEYDAVARGPGTFQLVRRRRRRMRKRTETMTLSFVEDRTGPRVRVVGDVDILLLERLTGRTGDNLFRDAADIPVPEEPEFTPVFQAPVVQYDLPRSELRSVRPAMPAAGMISAVPGAPPAPEPVVAVADAGPVSVPTSSTISTGSANGTNGAVVPNQDLNSLTVKRDRVDPNAASEPIITTADGTARSFARPLVIGRNPNPAVGPPGADIAAIADPSLSKSHCVLAIVGGDLVVTDMHSLNGTRVEADGDVQHLVPGQTSRPVHLPAVVWAGEARFEVAEPEGQAT